jgi:uncharacterized protein (DUF2147 family)
MTGFATRLIAIVAGLAEMVAAAAGDAAAVAGRWRTDDGSAIVAIDRCGAQLCGVIARVLDPAAPRTDVNNPSPAMRTHPLVGTIVLSELTLAGDEWRGGRAYDPKTGRSYRARLRLDAPDRLKVTGCVAFFCRTRIWSRAR